MKLSAIRTDPRLAEGAWVTDIPAMPGLALKVRALDNVDAQRIMRRETLAIPRAKRINGIDPADERAATNAVLRKAVLLDWSGLEDDDGSPIAFSEEMAARLIDGAEFDLFREAVFYAANVVREQGRLDLEDAKGN